MSEPESMAEDRILAEAEEVFNGWYANSERIDWQDFIDRLEEHTDFDFGSDMGSPLINKVKSHIRRYRKLG